MSREDHTASNSDSRKRATETDQTSEEARLKSGATWVQISDGTVWPLPDSANSDRPLTWVLRYGSPTREELSHIVSIVHAYGHLTNLADRAKRDLVTRDIRRHYRDGGAS